MNKPYHARGKIMDTSVTGQDTHLKKSDNCRFDLPLVSIVVINYNYGRFLLQAVDSVFEQTYPDIECIIIDNASTDDSAAVLCEIERKYPGATIIRRGDNGGQSIAMSEGFAASSGQYLVFLDADDVLLPSFVETHIFVHLSLRLPVGFTSADMFQSVDRRAVLGTFLDLNGYILWSIRSGRANGADLLRRIDESGSEFWPFGKLEGAIEDQVPLVEPGDVGGWYWAPTSGNCVRRDALQLFLNNPAVRELKTCTDGYLNRGISAMTGSVLIDRSLSIYRLHGVNAYAKHPMLYGLLHFDRGGASDNDRISRRMVIDHLVDEAALFLGKTDSRVNYIRALKTLDDAVPRLPSPIAGFPSYLSGRLAARTAEMLKARGFLAFVAFLSGIKVPADWFVMAGFGILAAFGSLGWITPKRDLLLESYFRLTTETPR
jgi:glycosyltransferase involved in cell wall biosynthesis